MSTVEAEFLKAQQARIGLLEEKKMARRVQQEQEQQQQHQPHNVKKDQQPIAFSATSSTGDNNYMGKSSFTFKRYRKAIALRHQQKQQHSQGSGEDTQEQEQEQQQKSRPEEEEGDKSTDFSLLDDVTLHSYENVNIHIWDNRIEILSIIQPANISSSPTTRILARAHDHPPTVLRNLRYCHIYYHLAGTAAAATAAAATAVTKCESPSSASSSFCWATATLHFVDLHNSTITFSMDSGSGGSNSNKQNDHHPIHDDDVPDSSSIGSCNNIASIHVTNCHTCTFSSSDDSNNTRRYNANDGSARAPRWLSCQQLRLHQSSQLDIYLDVTAGAILEDCTRLVFYRQQEQEHDDDKHQQHSLSVQDFGWLRPGVPSPNYQIRLLVKASATTTLEKQEEQKGQGPSNANNAQKTASDESDDDDEL
jgi:Tubulin binding cofactor C